MTQGIVKEERIGGQRLILGDIACKRVDEATRQADLFIETPKPQPKQETMI
jgi:hypothetical protein